MTAPIGIWCTVYPCGEEAHSVYEGFSLCIKHFLIARRINKKDRAVTLETKIKFYEEHNKDHDPTV